MNANESRHNNPTSLGALLGRLTFYVFFFSACKDLIRRFLTFNREQRLTLEEALGHAWLRKGYDGPVVPVHFPNYPRDEEIDKNILQYMIDKMEFDRQDVVDAVRQNR